MAYETRTRDITVTKELGYSKIFIHRPKFFYFEFVGLRPSTPHWMFFGAKEVTKWVNTSYSKSDFENAGRNSILKEPGEKFTSSTSFPSDGGLTYSGKTASGGASDPLYTDANGILKGLFYLQSNATYNWQMKSGGTELLAIDILGTDINSAYSYASTSIKGAGQYENYWTGTEKETYEVWVEPPRVVNNNSNDDDKTYTIHSNGTITHSTGGTGETYKSFHEAVVAKAAQDRALEPFGGRGDPAYSTPSNNGTVLCSLLHRRGYLSQEIWEQDHKFGIWMSQNDPDVFNGYHSWAVPMVDWIEKGSLLSKIYFHGWVRPFTGAWAQHIAHRMEPEKFKDNKVGRLMLNIGVPLCRTIGKLMRRNKGIA